MQHNKTKVSLSKDEYDLVNNAQILLTKNEIIGKVYSMFGKLSEQYVEEVKNNLPPDVIQKSPKISRGENYEGLPYVMLDYPRHFLQEDTFAIRTFFWWGNFFSSTILVKGIYKEQFAEGFINSHSFLAQNNFYICIADDEWDFRFDENNFKPVNKFSSEDWEQLIKQNSFIKLSAKIDLSKWNEMPDLLSGYFKKNLMAAGINFQDGEINL